MDVSLLLDQPDSVLGEAGYSLVHLCRLHWAELAVSGMAYEPVSECVMLEPDLSPGDTVLADYEPGGGDFAEFPSPLPGTVKALLQRELAPAADPWIESHRRYPRDQGFIVWFYLYRPAPGYLGQHACTLWFGGRYRLMLGADGRARVHRREDAAWSEESECAYAGGDWLPMGEGKVLEDGAHFANEWHRLIVLPLKRDRILIKGGHETGMVLRETDVLEVEDGGRPIAYATFEAPVRFSASGGAFAVSLSTPTFATAGFIASPLMRLSYAATAEPEARVEWEPRPGATATVTLLAEPGGGAFAPPAAEFAYRVDVTGPGDSPVALYDVRVDFDPTSRMRSPGALEVGPYVLELRESAAVERESARMRVALDNSTGALASKLNRCNMRAELSVNGARRFTGLTGASLADLGKAPTLELECEDLWKKLRGALLSDSACYDGAIHTEVVRSLLLGAGLREEDLAIAEDDFRLPSKLADDAPLFQPRNGESVATFVDYIRESFSGWRAYFDEAGVFHYEPDAEDPPTVAVFSLTTDPAGVASPALALSDEIDETGHANEVHVIGRAPDGALLEARFVDYASQNDPTCDRYVGDRRLLIWIDASLATQEAVNWVCRTLAEEATRFRRRIAVRAPYVAAVHPGDAIEVDGVKLRVLAMEGLLAPKAGRAVYVCEPV